MRHVIALCVITAAAVVPSGATVLFNDGAAMTTNDSFSASGRSTSGIILYLKGVIDGATIDLEVQPFQVSQGIEWIAQDECSVTTLPATCKVGFGLGDLRLTITGGGGSLSVQAIGQAAQAVVGGIGGGSGGSAIALNWDGDAFPNVFESSLGVTAFDIDDDGSNNFEFSLTGSTPVINAASTLRIHRADVVWWDFGLTASGQYGASGFVQAALLRANTSATSPSISIFFAGDPTTGLGRPASNEFTFISTASEIGRVSASGISISDGLALILPSGASPPAGGCSTLPKVYFDTTNLEPCICNGTNYVLFSDASTVCT